ncbi:hypothetical protein JGH11_14150 [Dysgonomonas sp. Marseille-P4677]|uniref:hypothetical protein n=1 Tax=Dysgonomonas sp. Marseille-P4677 TaxID=2364790 RepID=UPI0019115E66|nr:hypothetical protein [Dysgonomonas sp. Marseille-P4677]MBK5722017.1 hypothetical protein [Dysgonomonas sp. Marseille-P4677]
MKKIFTQKQLETKKEKVVAPSDKTLDFLKQFARTYYVEKTLSATLGGLCVN